MAGDTPVLPKMLSMSPPRRSICSTMPVAADASTTGAAASAPPWLVTAIRTLSLPEPVGVAG